MNIKIKEKNELPDSFDVSIEKGKVSKVKSENKFFNFLKRWYLLLIEFIVIVAVAGGGTFYVLSQKASAGTNSQVQDADNTAKTYTPKVVYLESPVNGALIPETKFADLQKDKVLTVMIENLAGADGARPQAGLMDADIVYETLAEGNITRYMAVFWNKHADDPTYTGTTDKVMPLRSARKYFIDWLMEYNDPLYMHIGQAESDNPDTNALGALNKYAIKDISGSSNSFDRDHTCEQSKAVEHCAWSDTTRLWSIGQSRGWTTLGDLQKLVYKDDMATDENATTPTTATKVTIDFLDEPQNYQANWVYDATTNTYLRSIGSTKHVDQLTGKQLSTKVLVVQKTSIGVSEDHGKWHKVIKTVGSGDAWIIQDGKVTLATWKKDLLTNRTRYYDKTTQKELELDRGKMWITVTGQAPKIS